MSDYNKRLFGNNIRGWFHKARFRWLESIIKKYEIDVGKTFELGCFDARSLAYFNPKPKVYVGLDAGWEGGLEEVPEKYQKDKNYTFLKSMSPADVQQFQSVRFSCSFSLETLEHIDEELIPDYINNIKEATRGFFVITVPNQKGILFLIKHLIKKIFTRDDVQNYSWSEFFHASLGNMGKVERHQHKGFDWEILRDQIKQEFVLVKQSGVQFSFLPVFCNPQVGFVFKTRSSAR